MKTSDTLKEKKMRISAFKTSVSVVPIQAFTSLICNEMQTLSSEEMNDGF